MKKISYTLNILFLLALAAIVPLHASSLIMGTVQFPNTITTIPMIRIYSSGQIIPYQSCETEHETKKFTFKIPKSKYQKKFKFLITESIQFKIAKNSSGKATQNTVEYLNIPTNQPYKLYSLKLAPTDSAGNIIELDPFAEEEKELHYQWFIEEKIVSKKRKIPDDAIIICYNPDWVEILRAETTLELPTIVLKKNLIELVGDEKNLSELSDKMLLASINSDTIHASMYQAIKQDHQRTTIAAPSA